MKVVERVEQYVTALLYKPLGHIVATLFIVLIGGASIYNLIHVSIVLGILGIAIFLTVIYMLVSLLFVK